MKKFVLFALAATSLFAQQKDAPAPPPPLASNEVIRVVELKNARASDVRYSLSQLFTGITESNGRLIVRGQPAVVDMLEEAIKKLDVAPPESQPAPNVELTVQLVYASAKEDGGGPIPTELEPTLRQLRSAFAYKSYRLMDTQILRTRSGGRADLSGIIPGGATQFNFSVQPSVAAGAVPRSIRLANLGMIVNQPGTTANPSSHASINANSLDAKDGQKLVVGKANLVNTDDAIFLVITPKVIE